MKQINWITGGKISTNWAYGTNARKLINKLPNYIHHIDGEADVYDIVVFFDILLMEKHIKHFPSSKKILRLSGERPFIKLLHKKIDYLKTSNKADVVISVSDWILKYVNNKDNVYVIPNSVDLKMFNSNNYTAPNIFTIGFSGNISNAEQKMFKGYDIVKETCEKYNINLFVASRTINEIEHKSMKLLFYDNISCLLHPSISEGCSNTISEALACGIPVISHFPHLKKDSKSVVICERDVDNIKQCIDSVKHNWKELSINGQKFIKENQDLDIISKQWEEIIEKL